MQQTGAQVDEAPEVRSPPISARLHVVEGELCWHLGPLAATQSGSRCMGVAVRLAQGPHMSVPVGGLG